MSVLARDAWLDVPDQPRREPLVLSDKLWLLPVAAAILAPLITWLPMLAHRYGLGLPRYEPARGIDIWHMQVLWGLVFALVAVLVGRRDRWLGWGVAYMGLGILLWGGVADITHRVTILGGIMVLWAVRQTPAEWVPMIRTVLAASGIFQAAYILQQILGYDLLWGPIVGGVLKPQLQPIGTLGTVDAATCYVAILAPLMPLSLLTWRAGSWRRDMKIAVGLLAIIIALYYRPGPLRTLVLPIALAILSPLAVAAVVVAKGHSMTAVTALVVGLLLRLYWHLTEKLDHRMPPDTRRSIRHRALAVILIIVLVLSFVYYTRFMPGGFRDLLELKVMAAMVGYDSFYSWSDVAKAAPEVVKGKLGIWWFGLKDWAQTGPVWGPAPWASRIPALQLERAYRPTGEVFMEAHNEYLQWLYEFGAVGLLLFAAWAWRHRRAFTGALAPSLWALAVSAGGFFVFHVVSVSLVGVILIGLATSDASQEVA